MGRMKWEKGLKPEGTVIEVGGHQIGGPQRTIIAGPCAIESLDQAMTTARAVQAAGANVFRGGAFKPRTGPYSFQGMGEEGLHILDKVRTATGLPIITEAMDTDTLGMVAEVADIVQIGSRNMQNFSLLKQAGRINKPVLLKRGMMATVAEWLSSAEYILAEGNPQVILCERGIRTFGHETRNTLDLVAVLQLRQMTHLPVIVDPSHAIGQRDLIMDAIPLALSSRAHGIMVEVHCAPETAQCDGKQSLHPPEFADTMETCRLMNLLNETVAQAA